MVSFPKISPNLLLGVGGAIAIFFIAREIRGAGQDLARFGENLKLPDIDFPSIPSVDTSGFTDSISSFINMLKGQQDTSSILAGETVPFGDDGTTVTIPADTTVDPETGIVTSDTPPTMDLDEQSRLDALEQLRLNRLRSIAEQKLSEIPADENISGAEFARERNRVDFDRRLREKADRLQQQQEESRRKLSLEVSPIPVFSDLPTENTFTGGGSSFVGGTIRENPIDTLSEVIKFFPELSASQAADFLFDTGGKILPSQVEAGIIDPDIRNIVAGFVGGGRDQAVPVSSTMETLSIRDRENIRAAKFTCEQFGLNCELANSMMA